MAKRKRIGLVTITLEGDSEQRIISGAMRQCEKYNYDLLVFSPLVHSAHNQIKYLEGELNIYELINFDQLDGVIVTPLSFNEGEDKDLSDYLLKKLEAECKVPVVAFNAPFGNYPAVYSDERSCMAHMATHIVKKHKCTKIDILAGPANMDVSDQRVEGIRDTLDFYGIDPDTCNLFYGDFWYSSGEQLAARYISGELPLPEAIICASDHMAIGLAEKLIDGGINVPDQVIVTGFGDTVDAVLSIPPITTYVPEDELTAAAAVNKLREQIEPESPVLPADLGSKEINICIGGSCGCIEDTRKMRFRLRNLLNCSPHGAEERAERYGVDSNTMQESYSLELFTAAKTPEECLKHIYESKYLLKPYQNFYICMNEDWLDSSKDIKSGYTDNMNLVLLSENPTVIHGYKAHLHLSKRQLWPFPKKEMLPALHEDSPDPSVYFFVPLHFEDVSLGYFCLQNSLRTENLPDSVFRTYIRYVSNALEMTRAKHMITVMSEHDAMTGLLNRRGMLNNLNSMLEKAKPTDRLMAIVADMDNLKGTNDVYGHKVGDIGIKTIANAIELMTYDDEICVRAGGDEFYILGIGEYTEADLGLRMVEFQNALSHYNKLSGAPLEFDASIGYSIKDMDAADAYKRALEDADEAMYTNKRFKKESQS